MRSRLEKAKSSATVHTHPLLFCPAGELSLLHLSATPYPPPPVPHKHTHIHTHSYIHTLITSLCNPGSLPEPAQLQSRNKAGKCWRGSCRGPVSGQISTFSKLITVSYVWKACRFLYSCTAYEILIVVACELALLRWWRHCLDVAPIPSQASD